MKETFYEVYGCADDGTWHKRGCLFSSKAPACRYALANKGKIAYGIPRVVERITTTSNDDTVAATTFTVLEEEDVIASSQSLFIECPIAVSKLAKTLLNNTEKESEQKHEI